MTIKEALIELEGAALYLPTLKKILAFKMARESLEKADKYRWHDLRKNPDDLPCEDGTYRCVFKDDINTYFDCDYRNGIGFGKECFDIHNELAGSPIEYYFEGFDEDGEVIGWQEIEPFEVKE